jgi:hypothetical protein
MKLVKGNRIFHSCVGATNNKSKLSLDREIGCLQLQAKLRLCQSTFFVRQEPSEMINHLPLSVDHTVVPQ